MSSNYSFQRTVKMLRILSSAEFKRWEQNRAGGEV